VVTIQGTRELNRFKRLPSDANLEWKKKL